MLNCSELIEKFHGKHPNLKYYPSTNKRNYECNLNDITASKIRLNEETCFTNKRYLNKRQKL